MKAPRACQCVRKHGRRFIVCAACKPLVLVESPLAGDVETNLTYAREALLDSLRRGEAPFSSHLLYTQVLDDTKPLERTHGIEAGLAWGQAADLTAVYTDLGISPGMQMGIDRARTEGRRIEFRQIRNNPPNWTEKG